MHELWGELQLFDKQQKMTINKMVKQILVLGIIVSIFGCKKVDKLTQFKMVFNETEVIPSSTGINLPFNILTPDIVTNSESTFAVNDTRKDLIEEITLTTLSLTISSPSSADFSFLQSINVYISADGLNEVKIAWKENVPADVSVLNLDITGVDLKEYIKADQFSLRLNTVTDELLTADHQIDIHSEFFVDAKILGQ
jgi:hypothetical protein